MHILVIDDDFVSRIKLQELLTMHGDCDAAETGLEALELFEHAHKAGKPYHLITVDINLPDIKGQDIVQKIRDWESSHKSADSVEAKILMVTREKTFQNVMSSFKVGCEWYLTKPVTPSNLRDSLRELGIVKTPA